MNFVKIPENGASWTGTLCYTIATGLDLPSDVSVEIVDAISGELLGRRRLYSITEAEFDIAPYVRNAVADATPSSETIALSPSARCVVVRAGGVESPRRMFYRAAVDCAKAHMLSSAKQPSVVARGDAIRLTLFARSAVRVTVVNKSVPSPIALSTINTEGMPVEVAISTSSYTGLSDTISVTIVLDNMYTLSYVYNIIEPAPLCRRIAWYNTEGGIECYTFPRSVRESVGAELMANISGHAPRLRGIVARYRLLSAVEMREEVERIVGIVFSPEVFECSDKECSRVKLVDRTIAFDDHGGLRRVELNIEKEWGQRL
ncbi:MAG: hypothetical protein IJ464_04265 [Alistipes sp.]|nr:hypothetical protein [Alistipes sp.]